MNPLRIVSKTVGNVTYYQPQVQRKYLFFFKKWVPFKCCFYTGGDILYGFKEWHHTEDKAEQQLNYYELLKG